MSANLHTRDLILRLKEIKNERQLTPCDIEKMLDAAGYHVSINSIRKVFQAGSEDLQFRFHDTLQPISRVLLGIYSEDKGDSEIDALHAAIRVKDELISKLEHELACTKTEAGDRVEFLRHQIDLKDERIDRLMTRVDQVLASNNDLLSQIQRMLDKL